MKLNFPDMLKLASKGYKPNDIAELSAIEETDLNKEQLFSLIDNGYNLDDIKFLRGLLSGENNVPSEESEEQPPEEKPLEKVSTGDNTGNEDQEEVDYKSLYEKEKKLREKLQHSNASELNASGEIDKRTNEEIAQEIANAILN